MRIAVCFSGHIRTGIEASDNLKRFFGELFPFCDFFIHTWKVSDQKMYFNTNIRKTSYVVDENIVSKIVGLYHPKRFEIEDFYEIERRENNDELGVPMLTYISPLMYSFMKSVEYKKEYEELENFEYDYVVKLRMDVIFMENRRLQQELDLYKFEKGNEFYVENMVDKWDINSNWCNDIFYLSKSKSMDIASRFYDMKKKEIVMSYPKQGDGIVGFIRHLIINGITIYDLPLRNEGYAIYREECFEFSPLTQVEECLYCDNYYYSGHDGKLLGYEFDSYYEYLESKKI